MIGLCHICYSSGISLSLDEDFEAKCEKCKKLDNVRE